MRVGAIVLLDPTLTDDVSEAFRQVARDVSRTHLVSVRLMTGDEAALTTLASHLASQATLWTDQSLEAGAPPPPPMAAAPFVYTEDGRPDWGTMWSSFCELALHGGAPHRGADDPVIANAAVADAGSGSEAAAELRRGIFATTGLAAEEAEPGWLAIVCYNRRMAAWMCAAIILENVDARCEGERMFVPSGGSLELTNGVKSVVTVVAKVHHYWAAHMAARGEVAFLSAALPDPDSIRSVGRSYRAVLAKWGESRVARDVATSSRLHQRAHELASDLGASALGRAELEACITDPVVWVRVAAAADAMRWAPDTARPVLESIRQAGGAGSIDAAFALMQVDAGRRP